MTLPERSVGPLAIGFDVGGTNVRGLAIDDGGFRGEFVKRNRPETPDQLLDALMEIADEIQHDLAEQGYGQARSAGVGIAGLVDLQGTVRTSPNIAMLENFDLRDHLQDRLKLPVVVDNDATSACWAEFTQGAGRDCADMVLVGLGTGIGGGIVSNSQVVRGGSGFAGEIGHMNVMVNGAACPCGRTGCWERYASGSALGEQIAAAVHAERLDARGQDKPRGTDIAHWASIGYVDAQTVLAEFAAWVAVGVNSLVSLLDPRLVVIGGGLTEMGIPLLEAVRASYGESMVDQRFRDNTEIVLAELGDSAGAVGAGLLALDLE